MEGQRPTIENYHVNYCNVRWKKKFLQFFIRKTIHINAMKQLVSLYGNLHSYQRSTAKARFFPTYTPHLRQSMAHIAGNGNVIGIS